MGFNGNFFSCVGIVREGFVEGGIFKLKMEQVQEKSVLEEGRVQEGRRKNRMGKGFGVRKIVRFGY